MHWVTNPTSGMETSDRKPKSASICCAHFAVSGKPLALRLMAPAYSFSKSSKLIEPQWDMSGQEAWLDQAHLPSWNGTCCSLRQSLPPGPLDEPLLFPLPLPLPLPFWRGLNERERRWVLAQKAIASRQSGLRTGWSMLPKRTLSGFLQQMPVS